MRFSLYLVFVCILVSVNITDVFGNYVTFSPHKDHTAAVDHNQYVMKNQSYAVNNIGVFILGSMHGATQFGEIPSVGHPVSE